MAVVVCGGMVLKKEGVKRMFQVQSDAAEFIVEISLATIIKSTAACLQATFIIFEI